MRKHVTLIEVMGAMSDALRNSLYHSMPASVQAFHPGGAGRRATVDCQPLVNDLRRDIDTGDLISEPWDVIYGVPVQWPCFGGFIIQGPLQVGDEVRLIAEDLDPTAFRQSGNRSDPIDVRRHGGGYWVAFPGGSSDPKAPQSGGVAGNALVIGLDGGQPQVIINGTTIQLGATGGDFLALATKVLTELQKIQTTLATGTAPSGGGAVTFGTPYLPASVASSLVKAQ